MELRKNSRLIKAVVRLSVLLVIILFYISCLIQNRPTDKEKAINTFVQNRDVIVSAVDSGDFAAAEKIRGIEDIYVGDDHIEFSCGGAGFGPNTSYYGFFYSASDDLLAWNGGVCPADELHEFGDGYRYKEQKGDNEYY